MNNVFQGLAFCLKPNTTRSFALKLFVLNTRYFKMCKHWHPKWLYYYYYWSQFWEYSPLSLSSMRIARWWIHHCPCFGAGMIFCQYSSPSLWGINLVVLGRLALIHGAHGWNRCHYPFSWNCCRPLCQIVFLVRGVGRPPREMYLFVWIMICDSCFGACTNPLRPSGPNFRKKPVSTTTC